MHLVLKVALFAFEIFPGVVSKNVGSWKSKRGQLSHETIRAALCTGPISSVEAFVMVFTFRFAEISSRLSSLALFSVATRKAFQSDDFFDVAGVSEQMLNLILLTGAPLVLLVDLLVLFCFVVHFQSNKANWNYAIPSVLCFMNPLLERGSPFTIPAWLYFTWRWVQLFGMAGVAFYLVALVEKY